MSETVIWELQFLAVTVTLGIALTFCYDIIRIFRRLIHHGVVWIAIEDILFWACCGIIVFVVSFWENDGRIRWYTLAGVAVGAYLYHETISGVFVKYVSKVLLFPVKLIKKALKKIRQSYRIRAERKGDVIDGKTKKKESV